MHMWKYMEGVQQNTKMAEEGSANEIVFLLTVPAPLEVT